MSFSAIYLHPCAEKATVTARRNLKATVEICRILDISPFYIAPLASPDSKALSIRKFRKFHSSSDFDNWEKYFPPAECRDLSELIHLVIQQTCQVHWRPAKENLTSTRCSEIFQRYESACLADAQGELVDALRDLEQTKLQMRQYADACQTAEQALQDTTARYDSLLSQLNLSDNNERSSVVQEFEYLNDEIEKFSVNFPNLLSDRLFEQYPDTKNCYNLAGLRTLFSQSQAPSLMLQSSRGVAVPTQIFLQLFSGSVICEIIHSTIFKPFYPFDQSDPESVAKLQVLTSVYDELRLRGTPLILSANIKTHPGDRVDSQMQSAKWRVDTVSALKRQDTAHASRERRIARQIENDINSVMKYLFGDGFQLDRDVGLEEIVARALNLNFKLKTEVIHLGDFHTEFFHHDHPYDGSLMQVLDAEKDDPVPKHIVSTCGLGLRSTNAVGGGKQPEPSILIKAMVADEMLYQ